jgi:hypothetical protein
MTKTFKAGATGLLLSFALAAPASAATVGVRVEGQNATLLPRTTVTPPNAPEPDTGCAADSAANALDTAVANNWDNQQFTTTILGETHAYPNPDYWGFWVFRGGRYVATTGICDETVAAGEELLAAYNVYDSGVTIFPLWLTGVPATVAPGKPVTVKVFRTACETTDCLPGEGHAVAWAGATVTAAGASATTGADGTATLTPSQRGASAFRATAANSTPSASEPTCVTDGADGYCGTTAPDGTTQPTPAQNTPAPTVAAGPDRDPATVTITGIEEGQVFARRKAPRELTASVESDPSGLVGVKLALSRKAGGRCWTFSGRKERFRRARCGRHAYFTVGEANEVSYLLPKRLGRGRYVLDAISIDGKYNRDPLARGRNRVVFTVK